MKHTATSNEIEAKNLTDLEIKDKIEHIISFKKTRYKEKEKKVLFTQKNTLFEKLPFSDFKISISQELEEDKLLLDNLNNLALIEENVIKNIEEKNDVIEEKVEVKEEVKEESPIVVIDELYDFDEEGKNPNKERYRSKIVKADTEAIIKKIKKEAKEKNKGKKVISFRDINKELKPYTLKRNDSSLNDDTLTSIDIYLNAVNKIETLDNQKDTHLINSDDKLELNLDDILNDLEQK